MKPNIDFFKIETNDIKPRKGRILIAEPFLYDFYFKTSIVLITEHNDEGTIGFVLNKPVKATIQDIIPDFSNNKFSISLGGPVSTDSLHYLHTLGEQIPGSIQVFDKVFWGGDFEVLKKLIEEGRADENQVRFFLGYSGWDPKQLEKELKENSWLVTNIDSQSIMNTRPDTIWRDVLGRLGPKYKMWINSPEDPSLN
jgi:putative transcriptional regulator